MFLDALLVTLIRMNAKPMCRYIEFVLCSSGILSALWALSLASSVKLTGLRLSDGSRPRDWLHLLQSRPSLPSGSSALACVCKVNVSIPDSRHPSTGMWGPFMLLAPLTTDVIALLCPGGPHHSHEGRVCSAMWLPHVWCVKFLILDFTPTNSIPFSHGLPLKWKQPLHPKFTIVSRTPPYPSK